MVRFGFLFLIFIVSCSPPEPKEASGEHPQATDSIKPEKIVREHLLLPHKTLTREYILKLIEADEDQQLAPMLDRKSYTTSADGNACEVNKFYFNGKLIKFSISCGECSMFLTEEIFYVSGDTLIGTISKETWYNYSPCLSEEEQEKISQQEKEKEIKTRYFFYYALDSLNFKFATKINYPEKDYPEYTPLEPKAVLDYAQGILNECKQ